ncbi:zinc-binding dehydrogenase [Ottowia sp. VDI28]|uniref:zinc-binding dehydrogenase n=1 Tax=Ottowia sp. VDI28 TaxID=3133968 RepID=UPI003C2F8332
METMKALILKSAGGSENLELCEVPVPPVRAGQVLVEVAATSINPIDIKIREGLPVGPQLPSSIGCDVSGTVRAVGPGVTAFRAGDQVYGCAAGVKGMGGAMAQFVAADARLLALAPRSMPLTDAAALALIGITASEGLRRSQVQENEWVLIQGANGGVGHIALQLAVARGARVAASVRSEDGARIARELGAHEVIVGNDPAHRAAEIQRITSGKGFDAVFDTVGGASLDAALQAAAVNGRVAAIAARSTHDLSPMHAKGLTLSVVFMLIPLLHDVGRERHGQTLSELAGLVDAGKVKVRIDPTPFDLPHAGAAQDFFSSGQARGKVLIRVA